MLKSRNGCAIWTDKRNYPLRYAQFYRSILEDLERISRKEIIVADVGCSRGFATYELKNFLEEHGYTVTTIGVDYHNGVLKEAYTSGRIDHAIQGVAQDMPIANRTVDVVVCNALIEYFPPDHNVVAKDEFHRILKDDGILATNEVSLYTSNSRRRN